MRGVSWLLFAWLLLAGMVSLLASSARAGNGPAGQSAIITSEADKTLRMLALEAATQPDETSLDPAANQDTHVSLWGASSPAPRHPKTTESLHGDEPTQGESVSAKALPIRGPPVADRA